MEYIAAPGRLRRLMRRKRLTGRELADLVGTSQATISRLVSGMQTSCQGDLGVRIERALKVELGSLFAGPETAQALASEEDVVSAPDASVVSGVTTEPPVSDGRGAAA
jgi:transcriptional regulator with XRE-family HTH domain